ncbi:MAG: hypothetical protein F6K00_31385 [Leptolyngbya sp. SIOISBB]|nr:hypothetical protein [Leptolyngbya sp. SIOISBB]
MKEIIPIIVSSISLLISLYIFFATYLRPARIKISIGNSLLVFSSRLGGASDPKLIGISFYLPITFLNWSHRGGEINQVRMVLGRPNNSINYSDMIWANFSQVTGDGNNLKVEIQGVAQPLAVPEKSSVSKMIRFNWSPYMNPKLEVQPGQYELMIFGWTEKVEKEGEPNLYAKTSFLIDEEIHDEYQRCIREDLNTPILIALGDSRLPNVSLTRKGVKKTFGK